MIFNRPFFLCLSAFLYLTAANAHAADMKDYPQIKIQALNKSTARTQTITAKVGSTIEYGSLYIKTQACRKSDPLDKPEDAAFLQIWEIPIGKDKSEWAFSGWMFSSSPAVSAMDHAVYDVWVLSCFDPDEKIVAPVNKVIVNDVEVVDKPETDIETDEQIDKTGEVIALDEDVTIIQNAEPLYQEQTSENLVEDDYMVEDNIGEDIPQKVETQQQEVIEVEPLDTIINDLSTYE